MKRPLLAVLFVTGLVVALGGVARGDTVIDLGIRFLVAGQEPYLVGTSTALGSFLPTTFGESDCGPFAATVDWGDGSPSQPGAVQPNSDGSACFVRAQDYHFYLDEGTYLARAIVTDTNTATVGIGKFGVTVLDSDIISVSGSESTNGPEGSLQTITVHFQDATALPPVSDPSDFVAADLTAAIDWGDGTTTPGAMSLVGFQFTSAGLEVNVDVSGQHTYTDEGSYTATVTLADDTPSLAFNPGFPLLSANASQQVTFDVSEADSLTATPLNITPTEGLSFAGSVANFTDSYAGATSSDFAASIDWGDGTQSAGTVSGTNGTLTVSGDHTYAEEGIHTLTVAIVEDGLGTATATFTSTANAADAPLSATGATLNETPSVAFTDTIATFIDADPGGTASDYAAAIAWGDGTTTVGTVTANGIGGFDVTGKHTYSTVGVYHPAVTINDTGGATAVATATISVTEADLSIGMGAVPTPVRSGTKLTYTVTITNNGPTDAANVALTDTLSPASTFSSISPSAGCITPKVGQTGTITCSLGTLAKGTSETITVVAVVTAPGRSTITDTAGVSSSTFDPNTANNAVSVTTSVYGRQ